MTTSHISRAGTTAQTTPTQSVTGSLDPGHHTVGESRFRGPRSRPSTIRTSSSPAARLARSSSSRTCQAVVSSGPSFRSFSALPSGSSPSSTRPRSPICWALDQYAAAQGAARSARKRSMWATIAWVVRAGCVFLFGIVLPIFLGYRYWERLRQLGRDGAGSHHVGTPTI